jgi:hypothetical protein
MLRIKEKDKEYTIDLNVLTYETHLLSIESIDDNGNYLAWGVEFTTNEKIHTETKGRNELSIRINLESILKEEYIVIKNYKNDRLKIILKPNLEVIRPKEYKFKITKKIINGRNLRIKILSKETNYEIPWKCIYDGEPLSYEITPFECDKGTHVDIKLRGEIFGEFETIIKFMQNKSNKIIKLKLFQTNNSVEIIEAD